MSVQKNWVVTAKRADFKTISEQFHIDPVIARVIRNRGLTDMDDIRTYLYGGLECLEDPMHLTDMDKAVSILQEKVREKKKIRIVGDYDIDGVMSSYILWRGFKELGHEADVRIPERIKDGYGINERIIEEAHEDGVDTIVTCDNGISAIGPIKKAKEYGMTVVVTDHHEVGSIPAADAVIDPKRPGDQYQNKELCGAAVAWKLILAMGGDPKMELMQYAAFATIGDVMTLLGENRVLVKEGLRRLRRTNNTGLLALADECSVNMNELDSYHIGFVLGPCINASGRLATAQKALALMMEEDSIEAQKMAADLFGLNKERRVLTDKGVEEALPMAQAQIDKGVKVLVLYMPGLHESICGIVAGRVREHFGRPTFVLTGGKNGIVKGSGRSTENYSMYEELCKCKELFESFGGHPMAAGISLKWHNLAEFMRRMNRNCDLTEAELCPKVRLDAAMPVGYVTEDLIRQLSLLEPFGKGNEKPLFGDPHAFLDRASYMGGDKKFLRANAQSLVKKGNGMQLVGPVQQAVYFQNGQELYQIVRQKGEVCIAYEPKINTFRGEENIQLVIKDFRS